MSPSVLAHLSGTWVKVSSPEPHVALVELLRSPVNAFHQQFWEELGTVFDKISEEPSVRAVVLTSALPKLFSAGIDVSALAFTRNDLDPARRALQLQKTITSFQASISALERCPYPVIVATHGVAYGLSIDIVSACDVRYAASSTVFAIKPRVSYSLVTYTAVWHFYLTDGSEVRESPGSNLAGIHSIADYYEVDVGLAADIGTLARLPKISGNHSLVHELSYTGRNFSAVEAEKMGLISLVVEGGREDVITAALDTAKLIAQKSPIAVLGTKHLLLHARDHTVKENLEYTAVWNSAMLQTEDMPEAIRAFHKKQKPTFGPLGPKL